MQTVAVMDNTLTNLHELVDALENYGVVVLNSVMRDTASMLRQQAISAMDLNEENASELITHCELEIPVDGEISYVTTLFYSGLHPFGGDHSSKLVERAMAAWVAQGKPDFYVFNCR